MPIGARSKIDWSNTIAYIAEIGLIEQSLRTRKNPGFVFADESLAGPVDPDLPRQALLRPGFEARVHLGAELVGRQDVTGARTMEFLSTQPATDRRREPEPVTERVRIRPGRVGRVSDQHLEELWVHRVAAGRQKSVAAAERHDFVAANGPHALDGA